MLECFCEMQVKDQFLDSGLCISALEHVMKLIFCSCVNITMPEQFCTMYEKCKFLSMGYISALTQASVLL